MKVKVKRLNEQAVIPHYAHIGDAGMDLTATSMSFDDDGCVVYGTGLAMEIPEGYVGLVFPRSSIAKKGVALSNAVGVIDSNFRGEILAKFKPTRYFQLPNSNEPQIYKVGERIAQLIIMPYPSIELVEANELSDTDRGEGGYGSTGC